MVGHPAVPAFAVVVLAPLQVYSSTQQPATKSWAKVLHERPQMAAIYWRWVVHQQTKNRYSSPLSVFCFQTFVYTQSTLILLIINNRSYPIYYMGCCPWSIGHYFNFTTRQTFVSRIKRRDTCNSDDVMANTGSCCTPTYLIYLVLLILNWSGKDTKKDIKCHWYTPGDVDCALMKSLESVSSLIPKWIEELKTQVTAAADQEDRWHPQLGPNSNRKFPPSMIHFNWRWI
jgi:hypothetical protein